MNEAQFGPGFLPSTAQTAPKRKSQSPRLCRGDCVSPRRAYCRQASQEALKKSAACITCPAAGKRAPFIQDYLSGNRKVVHLFPLRSMLEAKAFLLSPALLGVVISRKHTRQKTLHSLKWLCSVFQMVRGTRLELARCNHTPLKRARLPIPPPSHKTRRFASQAIL